MEEKIYRCISPISYIEDDYIYMSIHNENVNKQYMDKLKLDKLNRLSKLEGIKGYHEVTGILLKVEPFIYSTDKENEINYHTLKSLNVTYHLMDKTILETIQNPKEYASLKCIRAFEVSKKISEYKRLLEEEMRISTLPIVSLLYRYSTKVSHILLESISLKYFCDLKILVPKRKDIKEYLFL